MSPRERVPLPLVRLVRGLLTGPHEGTTTGPGSQDATTRTYEPGDDVRTIDWPLTARAGVTMVRPPLADREVVLAVALDASASMGFGTHLTSKDGLARRVGAAFADAAAGQVRAVAICRGDRAPLPLPPSRAGDAWDRLPSPTLPPPAFARAIRDAADATAAGGLVVVLSDFQAPAVWAAVLRRTGAARTVVAIRIVDRRECGLTPLGPVWLRDPETGRTRYLPAGARAAAVDGALRARAVTTRRLLRSITPWTATLTVSADWARDLVRQLEPVARGQR